METEAQKQEKELKALLARKEELSLAFYSAERAFVDDHHAPCKPDAYIQLRLLKMKAFYQARIPKCYRWRRFWELATAICSVGSATLAYVDGVSKYVALTSALAAAITSWNAHDDLSRRLERYSQAVRNINRHTWWWTSLGPHERAIPANITRLVEEGEIIVQTERMAWLSASKGSEGGGEAEQGEGAAVEQKKK